MSDLQIALAVLGIVVIGAVYAFNVWQERKLRRSLERAFDAERDDVLLKDSAAPSARIEPKLSDDTERNTSDSGSRVAVQTAESTPGGADRAVEYVVDIDLEEPVGGTVLRELQSRLSGFGKPARLLGWDETAQVWRVLGRDAEYRGTRLQAALQLVNRSGSVHMPQLGGFGDAVQAWASQQGAAVEAGDTAAVIETARALDELCGTVDIAIGLNVVAQPGAVFVGEQIEAAAAESGFVLESDGVFHWQDADGRTLFTMENHEPEPFTSARLAEMQTSGLTLLLDVPLVPEGEAALDEMARVGSVLAGALGGFVVDDNRVALQPAGLERIKLQIREIQQNMAAHGIPAGSARAQRLFS